MWQSSDPAHADGLRRSEGRVHIRAQRRWPDATTLRHLALHIPNALLSLLVVVPASFVLALLTVVPVYGWAVVWLLSGVLALCRPVGSPLLRLLYGLHRPTTQELARLGPLWREVTARAGVDASAHTLWVEESNAVVAKAAGGRLVRVTSHAVEHLPDGELAAVLARELGHRAGAHAWARLITHWYSLPGLHAWRLLRGSVLRAHRRSPRTAALVVLTLVLVATVAVILSYGLLLPVLAAPFLMAAAARGAELRADRYAGDLGLAPELTALLHRTIDSGEKRPRLPAVLARLLASQPDHRVRLHALEQYGAKRP